MSIDILSQDNPDSFPFGENDFDAITEADVEKVRERLRRAEVSAAIPALEEAFSGGFFDICPLLTMIRCGDSPARTLLNDLHCKDFDRMPMDVRVILYRAAMQCVRKYLEYRSRTLEFSDFPFPERLRPSASLKADFTPTGTAPELDPGYFSDILPILEGAWLDPEPVHGDIPYPQEMATPQELAALQQTIQAECPEPDFYRVPGKKGAYVKQKRVFLVVLVLLLLLIAVVNFYTGSDHPMDAHLSPVPGINSQQIPPLPIPNEVTPRAPAPLSAH